MGDFQIKYFARRLKELAQEHYGSNKNLSIELREGENYLNRYTNLKKPTEPRISFLYNLLKLGKVNPTHIFWLLTGEKLEDPNLIERLEKLEREFKELKAENYDLMKRNVALEEELKATNTENDLLRLQSGQITQAEELAKMRGKNRNNQNN